MDPRHVAPTLNDALAQLAGHEDRGFTFHRADATERFCSFAELVREASRRAAALLALGFRQGDRVALIIPDGDEFVLSFLGAVLGGIVPVPIYPQLSFKNLDSYHDTVAHIIVASGARGLVTSPQTKPFIDAIAAKAPMDHGIFTTDIFKDAPFEKPSIVVRPTDLCFLQFTSGSTAKPKGVQITHRNLAWNSECFMIHGLAVDPKTDRGVSWLPLFHDMGLIGFVMGPLFANIQVSFLPTASFVRTPRLWLETMSKQRGTISFAPNFAYALVSKRLKEKDVESLDLSAWRHAGSGAEPIQPKTLREFAHKLAPAGFKPSAFLPTYGMAEATLAISFAELYGAAGTAPRGLRTDVVIAADLQKGHANPPDSASAELREGEQEIVNCGRAFPEHEIAIVDEAGNRLGDRQTGHIIARGPSVSLGYFQDAEKTAEAFKDGWLYTGDLGYLVNGDVFICGRLKDMIIVRGRNFYPSDIEWAVGELERVRRGNVVAFGFDVAGEEQLVVLAEAFQSDSAGLTEEIAALINERFSLAAHAVQLVGQGTLPRTSSGKPQRRKTKEMYIAGAFAARKTSDTETADA